MKYQLLPALANHEREALEESIIANGVLYPILVDESGNVIDGHHRKEIADRVGARCPAIKCPPNLSDADKRTLSLGLNVHRRHLTAEQREGLVANSICSDPQLSNRMHAERTGTAHSYVGKVRARLESEGLVDSESTRLSADGRERPATQPPRPTGFGIQSGEGDQPAPAPRPAPPSRQDLIDKVKAGLDERSTEGELVNPITNLPPQEITIGEVGDIKTAIDAALEEFPFLGDYPVADVIPTADALRAIPPGPQRDRRIEAAKTWPAAVAAADDVRAAADDPADELRDVVEQAARWVAAYRAMDRTAADVIDAVSADERTEWIESLGDAGVLIAGLREIIKGPVGLRRVK